MEHTVVQGLIATTPRHLVTQDGVAITSFRLASSQRKFDRADNRWIDGNTNWFTITAFSDLAYHFSESFSKGDRVLIAGRIIVRDWDNGERAGTSVEIEARSGGHDLCWGTSQFTRKLLTQKITPEEIESN
jgi:single-strand DNA-binding protein